MTAKFSNMDLDSDEHTDAEPAIQQHTNAGPAIQQCPDMVPVQQLSIQLLNLRTLERVFPAYAANKNASYAINAIIDNHNQKIEEEQKQVRQSNKRKRKDENYDSEDEFERSSPLKEEPSQRGGYYLTKEYFSGSYSVKTFLCNKSVTSVLAQEQTQDPVASKTSHFILFFFRQSPCRLIFALTSGAAWMVVREYVNYAFPKKIANKVADPTKIVHLVRHCLFGQNAREELLSPGAHELYKTANLYYLVESFKCDLKNDSSLFRLISEKSTKKMGRCWINVTSSGSLRIGKRLCTMDFPQILDLLDKIVRGEPTRDGLEETVDPRFAALNFLQPAHLRKEELDKSLINYIYSCWTEKKEPLVYVRPKKLEEFLLSDSFKICIDESGYQEMGSNPPEIEDISKKIDDILRKNGDVNADKFENAFRNGKLKFKCVGQPWTKNPEMIIDCIEGQLRHKEDSYFKIRKMWYVIEADFWGLLRTDFDKLVRNHLIKPNEEGYLHLFWKRNEKEDKSDKQSSVTPAKKAPRPVKKKPLLRKKSPLSNKKVPLPDKNVPLSDETAPLSDETAPLSDEKVPLSDEKVSLPDEEVPLPGEASQIEAQYCQSYLKEPVEDGFLVLDNILPDGIESCDILKYTDDTLYLYYVKEKFDRSTRVVASQILNAATMIGNANRINSPFNDYLKTLWRKAVTVKDDSGEWRKELKQRLEDLGEQEFYNLFHNRKVVFVYAYLPNPKNSFLKKLESLDELLENHSLVEPLKNAGYLDSDRRLTEKFHRSKKETFEKSFKPSNMTRICINEVYRKLSSCRFSGGTLAKTELIQLAQSLQARGFDFKICEIPKYVDQCSERNGSKST